MPPDKFMRKSQKFAQSSHFIFKKIAKRLDELEGERAALELAQARLAAPLRVDPGLVRAMVRVFGRWALLGQERQRAALSSMQIRVAVRVPGPRRVEVVSVELGLLDRRRVYK